MGPKPRPAGTSNENPEDTPQDLAAANAEIERLRALLAARSTPSSNETLANERLADVLETIAQRLTRESSPNVSTQSKKLPDPPILTDGKDPTFESWKLQMRDKLRVNADHFPTEEARMAYVFSRTGGGPLGRGAQDHLRARYEEDSEDPFKTDHEMIDHLASIYEDPHKVQNARLEYRSLVMRTTETFADFHTRFLHLAGQAKIPGDDLRPDLFDKLTIELQRTLLPVYSTLTTLKTLADQCLFLDQGLRRIRARSDRVKVRNTFSTAPFAKPTAESSRPPAREPTPARTFTREGTPDRTRPSYPDPTAKTSNNRTCFTCGKEGHFAPDCPQKALIVKEVDAELEPESEGESVESEKEEP